MSTLTLQWPRRAALVAMLIVFSICHLKQELAQAKRVKCQAEECNLREAHFKLYSSIKRALDQDFYMKGKDVVPLVRSVEVLRRRFAPASQPLGAPTEQLNGTSLILALLESDKLRAAMEAFQSEAGRNLINLYRGSIEGNRQNLACSQWRADELELATRQLERDPKLAGVFGNVHKNFIERSARKCLKSACSSLDENMNRLDSVQRRAQGRRKGFVAREDVATGKLYEEGAPNSATLDELVAQVENEPAGEFQREELHLCQFFKRTNATGCQASGNELSEISFLKAIRVNNETVPAASLAEFLQDYRRNRLAIERLGGGGGVVPNASLPVENLQDANGAKEAEADEGKATPATPDRASARLLAQCRSLQPLLAYHTAGLRWFQRHELISSHKLQARTFWCPSLFYWLEIDRLCNELESKLAPGGDGSGGVGDSGSSGSGDAKSDRNNDKLNHETTFAY